MRILITNDDGIRADGIIRLAEVAKEFGEVWVVAPESERSAASHSISLRGVIDVYPCSDFFVKGVRAYSCSGTPADCVRVGGLNVMDNKPDVVLSGVNYGYNCATDIQYSATCGAAFEGAFQGYHAIAISEGAKDCHETTDKYLSQVLSELLDIRLPNGCIYNVNFPSCKAEECNGILYNRKVSGGMFYKDTYDVVERLSDGGVRYMVHGHYNEENEPDTDFRALTENYVSVGIVNNIGYCYN